MKKKIMIAVVLTTALFVSVAALDAYAFGGDKGCEKKKQCSTRKKGHKKGFEDKFYYKAHLIIKNQDELGLSEKQVKSIKDLKIATKKGIIRKSAEIDIIVLDIKSELWEDSIDAGAINALIDKKYDIKKEKAKSLVEAYAALKETLTEEQKGKLKDLCKASKKQ